MSEPRDADVTALHAAIDVDARRLHVLHAERLQCKRGCAACCVDELSVSAVEAAQIRRHHATLLATGTPHAAGACAFLDDAGACRIYAVRPYVCRTQGLPLRWLDADTDDVDDGADEALLEFRDICPLNEPGEPLELLPAEDCWTLGPIEERLARLQQASGLPPERIPLRSLFAQSAPANAISPFRIGTSDIV